MSNDKTRWQNKNEIKKMKKKKRKRTVRLDNTSANPHNFAPRGSACSNQCELVVMTPRLRVAQVARARARAGTHPRRDCRGRCDRSAGTSASAGRSGRCSRTLATPLASSRNSNTCSCKGWERKQKSVYTRVKKQRKVSLHASETQKCITAKGIPIKHEKIKINK